MIKMLFSSREDPNSYLSHVHQRDTGLGVGRFGLVQLDLCCDRDLYQFTGPQSRNISIQNKMNSTYNNFVGCIKHPTEGFQNSQSKSNVA